MYVKRDHSCPRLGPHDFPLTDSVNVACLELQQEYVYFLQLFLLCRLQVHNYTQVKWLLSVKGISRRWASKAVYSLSTLKICCFPVPLNKL